ncbi:hypothetical protein EG329_009701 [Mollisiaceae sp. DMI_Dod_QoI]|nr:hypothetical protein EG329_009701 [Helotiales sp. DMI_Dod_QoI]
MSTNYRRDSVIAWSIATVIAAAIVVILRLFTRSQILHLVGREDWCILIALFFSITNTIGMCFQAEYALGHHIESLSRHQITVFLKAFYFTVLSYQLSLTFTKISILFLYLRVFIVSNVRPACYVVLAVVILYGVELFVTGIFICVPAAHFWESSQVSGTCIPNQPLYFTNVSLNILTDISIILLPMPAIRTLVLPRRQKLGLYSVFALGLFVCIISILRVHWLVIATLSTDPTWDNIGIANWSAIEINTAIICACLTTLKPLLSHCFSRIFGTHIPPTKFYHQHSNDVDAESNNGGSKTNTIMELEVMPQGRFVELEIEGDQRSVGGFRLASPQPAFIYHRTETGDA